MRPWRSTTCTLSSRPPRGASSVPGAVSSAGADTLRRATWPARWRSERSSEECSCPESNSSTAMPSRATAVRVDRAAAPIRRKRSVAGLMSSTQREPHPADRVDERGITQLAAQVADIAVDDVLAHRLLPHLRQRHLTRDHRSRVAHQQLEELGLTRSEIEYSAGPGHGARLEVERQLPAAVVTACPSADSVRSSMRRTGGSSSTTRTCSLIDLRIADAGCRLTRIGGATLAASWPPTTRPELQTASSNAPPAGAPGR